MSPRKAQAPSGATIPSGAPPKPAKGSTTRLRRSKARKRKAGETAAMAYVRARDGVCRFPFCACARLGLRLEVAHQRHRGMGGNPSGDRSTSAEMVLVCLARHQTSRWSLHAHTVRWHPHNPEQGANGPIWWEALVDGWWRVMSELGDGWVGHDVDTEYFREIAAELPR